MADDTEEWRHHTIRSSVSSVCGDDGDDGFAEHRVDGTADAAAWAEGASPPAERSRARDAWADVADGTK